MKYMTPKAVTNYDYRKVDVAPQIVYADVPLELPMLKMSQADAFELRHELPDYVQNRPLDQDQYWNVLLSQQGMFGLGSLSALGATAAQIKAQQAAAARQAAAQAAAAAKQQAAQAAANARQQAQAAAQAAAAQKQAQATANAATKKAAADAAAAARQQAAADAKTKAAAAAADRKAKADQAAADRKTKADQAATDRKNKQAQAQCTKTKGIWDSVNNVCGPAPTTQCQGGTIDPVTGVCTPASPTAPVPAVCQAGYTNDPVTGACVVMQAAPPGGAPTACQSGYTFGANGQCVPSTGVPPTSPAGCPPGYYQDPTSGQCMSSSAPMQPQAPYGGNYPLPPVPASAPGGALPPPSFSSGGGGGGVSADMPPPPPDYSQGMQDQQFSDTANQFAPSVNQQDQSQGDQSQYDPTQYDSSQAQGDQQPDQAGSDDAGGVAMTNMAETIGGAFKSAFGMTGYPVSVHQSYGLGYMYGKTPAKKKDPKKPDYVTAQTTPGIPQSTTTAVMLIGGMAVLAAGAFFIFSRSKKAPVDDRPVRKNRGRRARRLRRLNRMGSY